MRHIVSESRKGEPDKWVASRPDAAFWKRVGCKKRMQHRRLSVVKFGVVAFALVFLLSGCDKTVAPKLDNPYDSESASYVAFPELTTRVVTQVSTTQAESGGSFGNDYGSEVRSKGVCWAEQGLPVVGGFCTDEGGGFDSFVSVMTGLESGVSYVVRSYATNADGTVYGGGGLLRLWRCMG